jgi:hypothetical protein
MDRLLLCPHSSSSILCIAFLSSSKKKKRDTSSLCPPPPHQSLRLTFIILSVISNATLKTCAADSASLNKTKKQTKSQGYKGIWDMNRTLVGIRACQLFTKCCVSFYALVLDKHKYLQNGGLFILPPASFSTLMPQHISVLFLCEVHLECSK